VGMFRLPPHSLILHAYDVLGIYIVLNRSINNKNIFDVIYILCFETSVGAEVFKQYIEIWFK
jgi:hypothetical protein